MKKQLKLFTETVTEEKQERCPWLKLFPKWMPKVNKPAMLHYALTEDRLTGETIYTSCQEVLVTEIKGDAVTVVFVSRNPEGWNKEDAENMGKVLNCWIWDLWPNQYEGVEFFNSLQQFETRKEGE